MAEGHHHLFLVVEHFRQFFKQRLLDVVAQSSGGEGQLAGAQLAEIIC